METHFGELRREQGARARDRIVTDLWALAHDSEALLRVTASDMGEKARQARERLVLALDRARSTCNELSEKTAATTRASARRVDTVIRAHPYESVGIAFGLGLLLGAWIHRR